MSLRIREIALHLDGDESQLKDIIAEALGLDVSDIESVTIVRRGIDARKKPDVLRVYTVDFICKDEATVLQNNSHLKTLVESPAEVPYSFVDCNKKSKVLIVGMGPAGLFSALELAEAGTDVCLIERGQPVAERWRDVQSFWSGGALDNNSNIQFGEGGAGTFSDGKLTCRLNHPATRTILKRLVEFGAPADILIQAKPHIGSDRLRAVLINLRKRLIALGVDIHFSSQLTGLEISNGQIRAGIINQQKVIACDQMIIATGHSARDTYELMVANEVKMERKAFAMGVRVEHPLELINQIQYGRQKQSTLPSADYRLAWNDPQSGRGIYSFCMCPGGMVVNASSEQGGLVVNGMSNLRRDNPWSNSALVVSVNENDFDGDDVLAGVKFQRKWERRAFQLGGADWRAPAQPLQEYLNGRGGVLDSSCQPGVVHADLKQCLPSFVDQALRQALPVFNRRMRGFIGPEAVLIGVETRTSAPVRIVRDQSGESVSVKGLYPAGEGAGYAGGIMSAALDGFKVAASIIQQVNES
jgi:uncharacterized protein